MKKQSVWLVWIDRDSFGNRKPRTRLIAWDAKEHDIQDARNFAMFSAIGETVFISSNRRPELASLAAEQAALNNDTTE